MTKNTIKKIETDVSQKEIDAIDKLFEKMSRECANKLNGTHPPKPRKIVKKKSKK